MTIPLGQSLIVAGNEFPLDSLQGAMRAWELPRDPSVSFDFIGLRDWRLGGRWLLWATSRRCCSFSPADSAKRHRP